MNKQGGVFIGIIVGIFIFMSGMLFVNFITTNVDLARNTTNLDCGNAAISDGAALTCLVVDLVVPYFIIIVASTAGGMFVGRLFG